MTTAAAPDIRTRPRNRTLAVVRLQFTNTQTFVWVPLIVLGGVWALTVLIYWIISASGVEGPMYGGGAQGPMWYFAVVGAQAMTLTFYFSQAMSLTRREFYLGSLLAAAITAAGVTIVFVILGYVERLTDGYGINGYFSYFPWLWAAGPVAAGLAYFTLLMLTFILGFWFAIVFKRFGTVILSTTLLAIGFVVLGVAALISLNQAWPTVWVWLADADARTLTLWAAALCVIFAAGSYLTLRRLTS